MFVLSASRTPRGFGLLAAGVGAALLLGLGAGPATASDASTDPAASSHGLGAMPGDTTVSPAAGLRAYRALEAASADGLVSAPQPPASVDLTNFTVPVGNQGSVGSCVTWAIDYAMLGWYANRTGHGSAPFAPMYAYSQIQAKRGLKDGGATTGDGYEIAQTQGVAPKSAYAHTDFDWQTLPTAAEHAAAAPHKTFGYATLYNTSKPGTVARPAIQTALANGQPAALVIPVYGAFDKLGPRDWTLEEADVAGTSRGWHEVLIVGYDETGVRIQNSWGTGWGDHGFAQLSWGFIASYSRESSVMTGFTDQPSPAPAVTGVTAASGPALGGQSVTVTGLGFTAATAVAFGTAPATFTVVDDAHLLATVPAGAAGTVDVTVTAATGTSPTNANARYRYVPAPMVTGLAAASGPDTGGTTVAMTGSGFAGVTAVRFGDRPASFRVDDDAHLVATSPGGTAGAVPVTLTSTGGAGTATFTYLAPAPVVVPVPTTPAPTVSALSPTHGPARGGTAVTIRGTGLDDVTSVTFNGRAATRLRHLPGGVLAVVSPPGSGVVAVRVRSPFGTSTPDAVSRFSYLAAPAMTSVAPALGATTGGRTVTITGHGFVAGTSVYFGGVKARTVRLTSGRVTVVTPRHARGPVAISVVAPGGRVVRARAYRFR